MNGLLAMVALLDAIAARLRRVTPSFGFTVEDLPILAMIELSQFGEYPTIVTGSILARRLHRRRQSVQQSLERLEARGILDARRDEMERSTEWRLTDKGIERWRELRKELARIEDQVFGTKARDAAQWLDELRVHVEQSTWLRWLGEEERRMSTAGLRDLVLHEHPDNPMGVPDLDRRELP